MGFFDDILIPADAMQHPSRLYPKAYCNINLKEKKINEESSMLMVNNTSNTTYIIVCTD